MHESKKVRFLVSDDKEPANFVYRPPIGPPIAENATVSFKFNQIKAVLDPLWILGGTPWTRMLLRLQHPFVYSKRGLRNLYRRVKRIFVRDKPIPLRRIWKTREELLEQYPEKNIGK